MTLPPAYSWYPVGEDYDVPYEAPQGRRVNGIGAYFSDGPEAGKLLFELRAKIPEERCKHARRSLEGRALEHGLLPEEIGTIDASLSVGFFWAMAGRPADAGTDWKRERPLHIVLDNYSVHTSNLVKAALPQLEAADVHLFYLPSYSPELSKIEPIWNDLKHHRITTRSFSQLGDLMKETDQALQKIAEDLRALHETERYSHPPP
jgi:hypothetical protein